MQKTKAKGTPRWQTHWLVYALLWAVGVAGMGWVSRELISAIPIIDSPFTQKQIEFIATLVPTMLMSIVPVLVTERYLKRSMRNWLVYTLLGTLMTLLWAGLFPWNSKLPVVVSLASLGWLWGGAFQMVWLRQRVKQAWLWPAAHILMWQFFRLILPQGISLAVPLPVILFTFVQQLVWACIMYYLRTYQAKDTEKAKVDMAAADAAQSDEARIQRLQEAEHHVDGWDFGENRARHNEV